MVHYCLHSFRSKDFEHVVAALAAIIADSAILIDGSVVFVIVCGELLLQLV